MKFVPTWFYFEKGYFNTGQVVSEKRYVKRQLKKKLK